MADKDQQQQRAHQAKKPPVPRRTPQGEAKPSGDRSLKTKSAQSTDAASGGTPMLETTPLGRERIPHLSEISVQEDLYEDPDLPALPEDITVPSGDELLSVVEATIPDTGEEMDAGPQDLGAGISQDSIEEDPVTVDFASQTEEELVPGDTLSVASDVDNLNIQMKVLKEDRKIEIERIRSLEEALERIRTDVTLLATAVQRLDQTVKRSIIKPAKEPMRESEAIESAPIVSDPATQLRDIRKTLIGEGQSIGPDLTQVSKAPLPRRRGP